MSIQTIVDKVKNRKVPVGETLGYLTRADVEDALKEYKDKDKRIENLTAFLSNFTFISTDNKNKIIADADSYGKHLDKK